MNAVDELRKALDIRIHGDTDRYYYVMLWEDEVRAFASDMDACIQFVRCDCTDEELYWLSEVFDDIMEKTRSAEFLQCLRKRAQQVENPEWKADILECIAFAALYIEDTP